MSNIFEHGYALIVGVDANQIPRLALPAVAKDVQAIYDVLVHPDRCAYNPENVKFLKGDQSTRDNILDGLYWLQGKVKGDPEATAVIYYSGHGMVDKATDQYYLIPYNISELSRIRQFALKAEDLTTEISAVQAKRMLAILDCCHAAGMDVKDVDLAAIDSAATIEAAPFPLDLPQTKNIPGFDAEPGAKNVSDLLDGEGRAVLNSSTGSQSSYVRTDGAMSLFTYHLIEALTGHAPHPDDATVVYVTDVMSWVTHQVKKSAKAQERDQTPVMRTSGVFPIAQLIGGQGVAKGMGQMPPDPLEALPQVGPTVTFNQDGQTVHGHLVNVARDANIERIGDNIKMGDNAEFVRGNKIINSSETFNMSGNFQGANVNVKSTLTNVNQTIGALPHADESAKQELIRLVAQLNTMLQNVPVAQAGTAEEIAASTEALVEMAAGENAKPSVIKMLGEGLKQTARQLADHLPEIVDVVTKIATAVATATIR